MNILFVCVENACRSQMAEAVARSLLGSRARGEGRGQDERIRVWSAGSAPSGRVNRRAVSFMAAKGYDLSGLRSKGLDEIPQQEYEVLVTMGCGDRCPSLKARQRLEWEIPDPKDLDDAGFRSVFDRIESKVSALFSNLP